MALKETLSALRVLILEPARAPNVPSERRDFLLNLFPGLSKEEAEDLSRIDQSGLRTYTSSIYTGQGELIQKFMPRSFTGLKNSWEKISNEKFSLKTLAESISQNHPWLSFDTVDLLSNTAKYISKTSARPPYLYDLALFEAASYKVRRAKSDSEGLNRSSCEALTVEEFLNIKLQKGGASAWLILSHDVLGDMAQGEIGLVVCRDSNNKTKNLKIPSKLVKFCIEKDAFSIEDLAEYIVTSSEPQTAFQELSNEVFRLSGFGALSVSSSELVQGCHFYPR